MRRELIMTLLVATVLLGGLSTAYAADPSLAGWWKLDDGAGTVAAESSGRSVEGTLFGDPAWTTEGIFGGGLLFDGADDYIFIDGKFELPEYTMAVWFRVDQSGQRDILSAYAVGVQHGILLELQAAGTLRFLHRFPLGTGGGNNIYTTTTYDDGAWYHAAIMKSADTITLFVNGEEVDSLPDSSTFNAGDSFGLAVGVLDDERGANRLFLGAMDEVRVHNRALSQAEVQAIMRGAGYDTATDPVPDNQAADVPRGVVLGWKPNEAAATHDVYFGTSFDDVNDASRTDPMGVLVSENQVDTAYDAGLLEYGATYYWRIDEVNGAPDYTIFKGEIWSFTVEPFAYAIQDVIATSNGVSDPGAEPGNTVNGSGLNADGQHSIESSDMWLATPGDDPLTITFAFDRVYKLHEMVVWNYNVAFELLLGFGVKSATVEYSADGAEWTALGDVELAQATATAGYAANTVIDLQGAAARHVRLTINSGHGGTGKFGLSEVQFMQIPAHAREPQPADGAADVAVIGADLSWRAGREAAAHEVYLSTDEQAVIDGAALVDTVSDAILSVDGLLDLGQTYFWKVNEVNEADAVSVWEGDVWSFATETSVTVDDFESYDDEDNRIYQTWVDGYDVAGNGSQVGHLESPFAEQTIVHGGSQSMPLFYENAGSSAISEATLTLDTPQDWTQYGVKALTLWFQGDADNTAGQLYVKINGSKIVYGGDAENLTRKPWQFWYIDLAEATGANLTSVTELTIGLQGGTGVLFIDDVALSPADRQLVTPTEPDSAGLAAHYAFEGDAGDGTVIGAPTYVAGQTGQAIKLDGVGDHIWVEGSFELPTYTAALWFRVDGGTGARDIFSMYDSNGAHGILLEIPANGEIRFLHRAPLGTSTGTDLFSGGIYDDGAWYHAAIVKTADSTILYVNGVSAASGANEDAFGAPLQNLAIGVLKHDNLQRFFPGAIDEVYLYSRALSQAEIASLAGRANPFDQ